MKYRVRRLNIASKEDEEFITPSAPLFGILWADCRTGRLLSIVREDQVLVSPREFYEESERRAHHCCGVEEDATNTHHCFACCQLVQQETMLEELEGEGVKE